jgi:uncharacterized protein Yka (UPF0111/DUF47 family)
MVQEMGHEELLLPDLIAAALTANDRIKYYLALLQSAQQRAEHPTGHFDSLREERENAQEGDARLDNVVTSSVKRADDTYVIPLMDVILRAVRDRVEEMLRPLLAVKDEKSLDLKARADRLLGALPEQVEAVPPSLIDSITSGDRTGPDSIHLLVMDVHRSLNALQMSVSVEDIDGAKAYALRDDDRASVASFMAGVNRTSPLKFEHPGLGTTATRSGDRLVIQNDIGETEAHLMIITVRDLVVSIVQTDIHLPRVLFFQDMFERWGVSWQDTLSRNAPEGTVDRSLYHLSRGSFEARDGDQLKDFLDFLGSRLVFLIDWNRARKKLQVFLPKRDAITVLRWAADHDFGHRGFLKLGGDQLIFEGLELTPRVPLRYGQPLHQVLGRERTVELFERILQKSSTDLRAQTPIRLIQDELKAELLNYFRPAPQELMALCIEHASLTFEVASALQRAVHSLEQGGRSPAVEGDAQRSKGWEKDADNIVSRVRTLAKSMDAAVPFVDLVGRMDDATDHLEEAMYLMTLATADGGGRPFAGLGTMADLAVTSCQEFIRSLYAAENAYDRCSQKEISEFLHPVDAVIELEESCDVAFRQALAGMMAEATELRSTIIVLDVARNLEESTDSLMKAAYVLKEHIFDNIGSYEVR